MKLKRKTAITVYLFTASLFLTSLWRFSNEEKMNSLPQDIDRVSEILFVSESVSVYESVSTSVFPLFGTCILPLENITVTSDFGYREDPFGNENQTDFHSGIDLSAVMNSEVKAISYGTVSEADYDEIGGNYVKITHPNGLVSYYGHLSQINVSEGDEVNIGQIIGLSGESGKVTGPHLHFGLYYKNNPVDPDVYLNFNSVADTVE